jgi:hypothetical protein
VWRWGTIWQNELPAAAGCVWRASTISQNELPPSWMGVALKHHFEKRTWLPEAPIATRDSLAEFVLNLYFQFPSGRPALACLGGGTRGERDPEPPATQKPHFAKPIGGASQSSSPAVTGRGEAASNADGPAVQHPRVSARFASRDSQ